MSERARSKCVCWRRVSNWHLCSFDSVCATSYYFITAFTTHNAYNNYPPTIFLLVSYFPFTIIFKRFFRLFIIPILLRFPQHLFSFIECMTDIFIYLYYHMRSDPPHALSRPLSVMWQLLHNCSWLRNSHSQLYLFLLTLENGFLLSEFAMFSVREGACYVQKKTEYPWHLPKKMFRQRILPISTYGGQTWTLTKANVGRLIKTQRIL